MNNPIEKKNNKSVLALVMFSAVVSSIIVYFVNIKKTAVTWPAIDNLPAVCRILDKTCLLSDFFTNASSDLTPRSPYIYVLSEVTRLVDNGIGGGLAVIKAILLALLPALMGLVIFASINLHASKNVLIKNNKHMSPSLIFTVIAVPILILSLQGKLGVALSVAWWMPLYFDATPHNVSIFLTLIGFVFIYCRYNLTGAIFVFLGGIIHPAVGIFTSIFSCILFSNLVNFKKNFSLFVFGFTTTLLAAVLIKLFFESGSLLSTQEFVRIYVIEGHPAHYLPSQFGSFSRIPWYASFLSVVGGLILTTIALYAQSNTVWRNSFLALIAYLAAVACQFFFVEVYPIKIMAILGPSRFTMFGSWFLSIFAFLVIANWLNKNTYAINISKKFNAGLFLVQWRYVALCCFLLLLMIVYYSSNSNSYQLSDEGNKKLVDFAINNTNKQDVFALPFYFPRVMFPLVTERGVFHGNGFPFSEKYFSEWDARNALINGSNAAIKNLPGSWIGEKYANHYRALFANDFINAASRYRLDWVVVESEFSNQFASCKADFESLKYKVYSIISLKICAK
ncbi:MAG: hypothetical protein DCC88_11915 [Spirobacillus cienkowskii]|jgi:hypothetical protein|uniref:Glycosyltransferase RgtA/B/C/D-like domain-containing protein n=1 Tax=Spirobacillus cienkowskii TaxID=495820 RepID=A0A369KNH8_9BACT|nr:MAG: hypothetical protein DCC88_11915 [Spirobacillus cienkowskii]